jgi:hypothetical protein
MLVCAYVGRTVLVPDTNLMAIPPVDCRKSRKLAVGFDCSLPNTSLTYVIVWLADEFRVSGVTGQIVVTSQSTLPWNNCYLAQNTIITDPVFHIAGTRAIIAVQAISAPSTWNITAIAFPED